MSVAGTVGARPRPSIRRLDPDEAGRWDAFVEEAPEATFFHRAAWREALERSFGHRAHYLLLERNGEIDAVLPLVHVQSRLFGSALISLPFCTHGAVVSRTEESRKRLQDAAVELGRELGVSYVELRDRTRRREDWPVRDLYLSFRKPIDPRPERNLAAVPRKQRAVIRKAIASGLESEIDGDIGRFYDLFSISQRNLGTPVASRRYFGRLREAFGADCEVLTVTHRGRAVCSVMSFYFRDEVLPYHGGGTPESRTLRAQDFMYWELMRRAAERGVRVFDFGRSRRGSGSYHYKRHWGFTPEPLFYEVRLLRGDRLPDCSPGNRRMRYLIEAWKRLPLPLHRWLGPKVIRHLG